MKKSLRQSVYKKYDCRCAYCGKLIEYKDMQVDHIWPVCHNGDTNIENLNPACRSCNHYKRAFTIEKFRELLTTLHERIQSEYLNKVGIDYGIVLIKPFDGIFYFEKLPPTQRL